MTTIVTVNTDASYHPQYKVGGYAFWIVYQGIRTVRSGPLKDPRGAHDCEIKAIANALHTLVALKHPMISYIIINTDSQLSIDALLRVTSSKHSCYKEMKKIAKLCHKYIHQLKTMYGIGPTQKFIQYRKVKAHSDDTSPRSYVNNYLDKAAKLTLKEQIESLKKE